MQRVAVGACRRGERPDFRYPRRNVIGNPQRRYHMHAPRGAEIAQRPEIHPDIMPQATPARKRPPNRPFYF